VLAGIRFFPTLRLAELACREEMRHPASARAGA